MPAGFHDVRMDENIERGAKGGPMFRTVVLGATSGQEQRNIEWTYARSQWNVSYGMSNRADFAAIMKFFYARRGRAYAFRFKDWTDYTSGEALSEDSNDPANRSAIGVGDGTTKAFQLYKFYTDAAASYTRKITRPVASSVVVWVNNVLQTLTSDYTLDDTTGIITFVTAPASSLAVEAFFLFDVPCRFDTDKLDVELEWWNAGSIPDIIIVEIRE